jgi:hypothetical protein
VTVGLTYNTDLSRVQIALSSLPDGTVRVERSLQQTLWSTVRGGRQLPVTSGAAALDDFEFFDGETFYRVVPVDPPAGLLLDGTSGDYASTPDHASLDITGDLDLRAYVTADDWTPASAQTLVAKWTASGDERQYRLWLDTDGTLNLSWSTDGTAGTAVTRTSTVAPTPDPDTGALAVRATLDVDDGASGHVVTFYTAATIAGSWTQLGDPVTTAGTTSVDAGAAVLEAGSHDAGTAERFIGVIHAVEVYDGIDGTAVANPVFEDEAGATASFDDAAGRTWTVQGSAEIVGIQADSITASLAGEVWLKSIRYAFLNRIIKPLDRNSPIVRGARTGVSEVSGRAAPVAAHDLRKSREFELHIITTSNHVTQSGELDLMLAAGGTLFIHVPAGSAVPGGYVAVGDTDQTRLYPGDSAVPGIFVLPCRVVAEPGPDVVGSTLTWATVRRLYGDSWEAARAANPALPWSSVGSEDDVVVLQ